jgi:site-specific DNA recombinase
MNACLYLRMSSDKQEASIPQQEKALRELAERKGYRVVEVYRDEGISGDATDKRKAFLRMIAEASAGRWKRILAYDQDRFGRFDMLEAGYYISPLRKVGVCLETIAQGVVDWNNFAGRVIYGIQQEGKHQFLRDVSRNTLRGMTAKAEAADGFHGGPTPYGYRRQTTTKGSRRVSRLVPEPAEAAVVRRIFEEYSRPNASCGSIASGLSRDNVPTARGCKAWRRPTIRRLLASQTYAGDFQWGLRETGKYSKRTTSGISPAADDQQHAGPIVHRDAEVIEPIVPRDLFDKVQCLMVERKRATRSPAKVRPLSGIVFCKTCGQPLHSDGSTAMRCSSSATATTSGCSSSRIPTEPLLTAVVAGLRANLLAPTPLAKIERRLLERLTGRSEDSSASDAAAEQLRKIEAEIANGTERIPMVPASILPGLLKTLDAKAVERDRLVARMAAEPALQAVPVEKAVQQAMAALRDLGNLLTKADPAAVNAALRGLGVVVRASPGRAETSEREAAVSVGDLTPIGGCSSRRGCHGRDRSR